MLKIQKHIVFFIFSLIIFASNITTALNNTESKDYLFEKANNFYAINAFDNSIASYNQLLKLINNQNSTDYTKVLIGLGKCYTMKGNYDIALSYFKKAENIINKIPNRNLTVFKDLLLRKGNILAILNKSNDAIITLNKLLNLKKKEILNNDKSLILIYENLGSAYLNISVNDKALSFFNQELELSYKWKDINSTCNALFKIAECYFIQGDYLRSMEFYDKSESLLIKYNKTNPKLAAIFIKKGELKTNLSDYFSANNFYDEAEKIFNNAKIYDIAQISYLYLLKGHNYYLMGNYEKALTYYEKTLRLYSADNMNNHLSEINNIYHHIGNVYLGKKDYTSAINNYSKCIYYNLENNPVDLANNYNSIAIAYKRSGNLALATKNYKLAINNRIRHSGGKNVEIAKDYLNYGELLMDMNKNSSSLNMLMKSYSILKSFYHEKHPYLTSCLTSIGNYYLKINKPEKALNYYQDAIIAIVDNFNSKDININPTQINYPSIELLNALKCKANVLNILAEKNKNTFELLKNSYNTYNLAISLVSRIHNSYSNDESKLFIAENEKQTYINALEVSEKLFKLTGNVNYISLAYQFAEKSKASVVLSNLRESNALNYGDIPAFLKESEQNIKNNISANEKLLYIEQSSTHPDQTRISNIKNKIFDLEQQKEKLLANIESHYKSYYNLKYSDKVIDIKTVQSNLKEKESVIEFVLSDRKIYTFLITKNFYNLYSQKIDADFNNNIDIVRKYTSTNTFGNSSVNDFKSYTTASYSIYKKILQPIESYIKWNNLIIIPDEKLNLISFETLLYKPVYTSDFNFSKLPYLILEHPISYSYSTTILYSEYNNTINSTENKVLAFAPDYRNINKKNLLASSNYRNDLSNLKNTKEETSKISSLMNGKAVQDNLATKSNFLSMSKDYNILHLAMHAIINDENPMYSELVFSQNQQGNDDVMLNTGDIYNMHLNSKLVVLSACNTGNGQIRKGEGIMSLARAFFYAGCPSVVMTLWSVEDKASSDLMYGFYKYISQGYSKDKAMQLAKIDYLQNNPPSKTHPFFWAGYVAIGDESPLYFEKDHHFSYAYLLLLAGVGIGLTTPFITNRRLNRKLRRKLRMIKYFFIH